MRAEDVKKIRDELGCSLGELAETVGVDVKTVLAWEAGDLFPTKKHAAKLTALAKQGPSAIVRKPRGKPAETGMARLSDPRFWAVIRKLVQYPELFGETEKLAERYDDPGDP